MYSFLCDYSEGAHQQILDAFIRTNLEQTDGYGIDCHCDNAASLIRSKIGRSDVDVHFFVGGTQTNMTAIAAFLKPYEAVISAKTAHINVHETGAIEATGHKILIFATADGKLTPDEIQTALDEHEDEHMAKPKLVYISNTTEIGTVYTKSELKALSNVCRKNSLLLYMDGARLGSALMSEDNDLSMSDIADLVDAFYIGATKNGALMGEALVISNSSLTEDFRYNIKQRGGLLAKGRLLGIQFEELFRENLYFELADHANKMAYLLREGFLSLGYPFMTQPSSNQLFPILPNKLIEKLEKEFSFYRWKKTDDEHSSIRLVTSWATDEDQVHRFIELLKEFHNNL